MSKPAEFIDHDDFKSAFDEEIKGAGDGEMSPEERRAVFSYFIWGVRVGRGEVSGAAAQRLAIK